MFDDPAKRARWEANDRWVAELYAAFPDRWWSPWLGLQMDRSSKLYPPPLLWLLAGVVGVALAPAAAVVGDRRAGRAARSLMLLATVMAVWAEPAYAVPVVPAFVLFAAVALLGDRTRPAVGQTSAASTPSSSAFRSSK